LGSRPATAFFSLSADDSGRKSACLQTTYIASANNYAPAETFNPVVVPAVVTW